jgi:hypothetical protein
VAVSLAPAPTKPQSVIEDGPVSGITSRVYRLGNRVEITNVTVSTVGEESWIALGKSSFTLEWRTGAARPVLLRYNAFAKIECHS